MTFRELQELLTRRYSIDAATAAQCAKDVLPEVMSMDYTEAAQYLQELEKG